MATFFESLRRIFMGEPVFKATDAKEPLQHGASAQVPRAGDQTAQKQTPQGPKVLPQVMISRWQVVEHGGGLHSEIAIKNYSQQGAVLERIDLLGIRDELGRHLDPGEEYEYVAELPARPTNTNLKECNLYFKTEPAGDYFCAMHLVEFEQLADRTYKISRFRFLPPIRDV